MVWGLFPNDPLPGEDRYYIFSKGTYKVGRKGCDVIVNKDKGVSRIHAEIVVDVMSSLEHLQNKSSNISSNVRIRDCSKYGTFISKNLGAKEKVHEFPNKEATLKDGDLVSFGTGNATYRFCFVPLIFLVYSSEPFKVNQLLEEKILSIGACMTCNWSPDCTHVLVNQFMPLTEDVIDPFVAKKPFVLKEWIEVVAEKNICTEIPCCSFFAPTLMLEGVSVKVADPKSRENCLRGFTFLLEPIHKYNFKNKLWSLLEMVGAKVVSIEGYCSNNQGLEDEEDKRVVLVIPPGLADKFVSSRNLSSLSRVKEKDLICAAFSAHLDPSVMVAAPVVVSSSCSTDETVVADSDVEAETAISVDMSAAVNATESTIQETEEKFSTNHFNTTESTIQETKEKFSTDHAATRLESDITCPSDRDNTITARRDQVDEPESGNPDIIYSQNLIVRDTNLPASVYYSPDNGLPNFKCFRKIIDSDYGSEEVVESVKEEKKRKQMEAISEDLFNNVKGGGVKLQVPAVDFLPVVDRGTSVDIKMNTEEADEEEEEEEEEEEDLLSFKRFLGFLRTFLVHRYSVHPTKGKTLENPNCRMSTSQTCYGSSWTREQDKAFENALAIYSEDSSDRWEKIAAMVPGKTIEEIKHHYQILVEDINAIESGYVPLPHYVDSTSRGGNFGQIQSDSCHGGKSSRSDQERRRGIAWSEEEHRLFLLGLEKYGKGDWRSISRHFVVSRTPTQVASHAQKYFIRLNSANKERRRSSIHDITTVGGGDSSTSQGPITGQTDGTATSGSSSRRGKPAPSTEPDFSTYVPPTIVQSIDSSPLISTIGNSVDHPYPAEILAPDSNDPTNVSSKTFQRPHSSDQK
ncbi:unnamed protein product [Camellia sinensis]